MKTKAGIDDNYIGRAFFSAPSSIFGALLLFLAAATSGVLLVVMAQWAVVHIEGWIDPDYGQQAFLVYDPFDLPFFLFYSFGGGMLSCVGLIFLGLDYLMIRRLLYEEETSMKFFLAVAANQVALTICAGIPWGSFLETLPGGAIALLVVGLAYRYVRRLDQ